MLTAEASGSLPENGGSLFERTATRAKAMRRTPTAIFFLAFVCPLAIGASRASAHAPDEYGHNTFLTLGTDGLRFEMRLTPGPLVGARLEAIIDTNSDGTFSEDEITRYGESIAADLTVSVDSKDRPVTSTSITVPPPLDIRSGGGEIIWTGIAAGSAIKGEVRFEDHHQVLPGKAQASLLASDDLPNDLVIDRSIERGVRLAGTFIPASSGAAAKAQPTTAAPSTATKRAKRLQGYLRDANSIGAIAAALSIAALLGALHALTPGHGKTIAAAYLVGEHATVRHAIVLGGSVTITHTASVLALGAVSLGVAGRIDPATLTGGLRWISGLLVLGIGLTLLVRRLRGHSLPHDRPAHDHAAHDHAALEHGHSRNDGHDHDHPNQDRGPLGLRRLVALGASGGLIPCPEALGVLIVAVAVQRQLFGMAMIVSFSLGLASVLVAIGILLVRGRRVLNRFTNIPDVITNKWVPVFSAAVVSLLGLAILSGRVV